MISLIYCCALAFPVGAFVQFGREKTVFNTQIACHLQRVKVMELFSSNIINY